MAMQVREFAEQILFGPSLEDKLLAPVGLIDTDPKFNLRSEFFWPGRGSRLGFSQTQERFPNQSELRTEAGCGRALHSFANHELLAIETMAYTLLKFHDAPTEFRQDLIDTIVDEQKHLSLYIERMRTLGVEFGDLPLNDFFWKSLHSMSQPIDFSVRMSLLFEQANLDFAKYYADWFRNLGDTSTAKILSTVLADELRHVQTGLKWFDQWRPEHLSRWQSFSELLPFPLTAQRAKGKSFQPKLREKIGLDRDYIDHLATYSASKGRVPHLYLFWPDCEDERTKRTYTRPQNTVHFTEDLAYLPAFAANSSDTVVLPKKAKTEFLLEQKALGLEPPEVLTPGELKGRKFNEFRPWGYSKSLQRWCKEHQPTFLSEQRETAEELYSKATSLQWMQEYARITEEDFIICSDDCGVACSSLEDVKSSLTHFFSAHSRVVIKAPFGASGRGFLILESAVLNENQSNRVQKILAQQKVVVVEPWLEKCFDFSLQIEVLDEQVRVLGPARFIADSNGTYRGALLGGFTTGLTLEEVKFLNNAGQDKNRMPRIFKNLAEFVAEKVRRHGYTGPVGIDALVFRNDEGDMRLKPIVETNCRYNMGRIVVSLEQKLSLKGIALWRVIHSLELHRLGHTSFEELEVAARRHGLQVHAMSAPVHDKVRAYLFQCEKIDDLPNWLNPLRSFDRGAH